MKKIASGELFGHGAILSLWMLFRAAIQAGIILLLAKELGAESYGKVVAVIASVSFIAPFVGLGLSHIVLRNCSIDPAGRPVYLGRAQRVWLWTLPLSVLIATMLAWLLMPDSSRVALLAFVALAELSSASLVDIYSRYWQACQRTAIYGMVSTALPVVRLLSLSIVFSYFKGVGAEAALLVYSISSLAYVFLLIVVLPFRLDIAGSKSSEPMSVREGVPFSLAAFTMKLQAEFNKPILAHAGFGLAGNYNVAQRIVEFASLPLVALQEVLWPRLYAQANPFRQLIVFGFLLFFLAVGLAMAVWFTAPLIPFFLGSEYESVVSTLRLLAWLPILQLIRGFLNFHAIYFGRMQYIGFVYFLGGVVSVLAVSWLVPEYGLFGAVVAGYVAEVFMVAWLVGGVLKFEDKRLFSQ